MLCEPLLDHPHQSIAMHAAFVCGTAHSLLGVDLAMARSYLERAERVSHVSNEPDILPRIYFEQGSILAQQGDIPAAIGRYHAALSAASATATQSGRTWQILAHNNLAYHIHLLGNYDEATRHARLGLRIAQRSGVRMTQSYLHSTMGEIALAQGDLDGAERHFFEGLDIAERYGMLERIAGIEANIGLVARAREDVDSAIQHLKQAMTKADALGVHHLAAQIRIWLATLVDAEDAAQRLNEAIVLASNGGRQLLLKQIEAICVTRGLASKISQEH
jgi:tetratricopeptide (TPR) repeat protein